MVKLERVEGLSLIFTVSADKPIAPYRYLADRPWRKEVEVATEIAAAFPGAGIARKCTSPVDLSRLAHFGDTKWRDVGESVDIADEAYLRLGDDHWFLFPTTRETVEDACYIAWGTSIVHRDSLGLRDQISSGTPPKEYVRFIEQSAIASVYADFDSLVVKLFAHEKDRLRARKALRRAVARINRMWS